MQRVPLVVRARQVGVDQSALKSNLGRGVAVGYIVGL